MQARKNTKLATIIKQSNLVIPDGSSIILSLKLINIKIARLPGIELAYQLLQKSASNNLKVALIGAKPEVLDLTKKNLNSEITNLNIIYSHDGYFDEIEEARFMSELQSLRPQLVLVALGVPRQEYFINKWSPNFEGTIFVGVGGSFDVWAKVVNRAPKFFCDFHLEWFYRLIKEPWRFNRMVNSLPIFMSLVLAEFITKGKKAYLYTDN